MSEPQRRRRLHSVRAEGEDAERLAVLVVSVSQGDEQAFSRLYDDSCDAVFGLVRRIVRDPARAEEVTQEIFLQVWQTAHRFAPERGSGLSWILTLAHRRAVDAVRHDQAATDRENRYDWSAGPSFDHVEEEVTAKLEHEQVRRCLETLTSLQRQSVDLAYYSGHTYADVADLLDANPATIKTRMRDGLIRLRDCLGVASA